MLKDETTDATVSYLFWEALTQHTPQNYRRTEGTATFCPTSSVCSPKDSVLLPTNKVAQYLDRSLRALGLHTEAKTSFIIYWLPALQKHEFVALRFVPQKYYEAAAPLDITPKPDVVTRVFMLFQGVKAQHKHTWQEAEARAAQDVSLWTKVVGVDSAKQQDATLFRALEWGGMEVFLAQPSRNLITTLSDC